MHRSMREVFGLTFYHGWGQKEIGELIQKDERTVRRRWRNACLALHEMLKGQLPTGADMSCDEEPHSPAMVADRGTGSYEGSDAASQLCGQRVLSHPDGHG